MIGADPVGTALLLVAPMGIAGVFVLSLMERVVPILPSQGLFAAFGIAAAEGLWCLSTALSLSVAGSSLGAAGSYAAGLAVTRVGGTGLQPLMRRRDRWGRWLRAARRGGSGLPFTTQMLPTVRLLAPLIGGAMRADPRRFLPRMLGGLAVWNGAFIALGYLLARLGGGSINLTLVCLLLAAGTGLVLLLRRPIGRWRSAMTARWADRLRFLRAWWRDPLAVASLVPSGRALATLITRDIDAGTGPVLELGSGTGVFAQRLIERGVPESALTLVELDGALAGLLSRRFPAATILSVDAAEIADEPHAGTIPFGAAVCGLGLLNMPAPAVEAVLAATFARLQSGAACTLFTYGRRCSVPADMLHRLGLAAERTGTAWWNLPPATVYRLTCRR
ncbi:hypothetical protein [Croceibacterium ferulae]|uniref:hypothetical protein n=1 Tax=Croceibacterium ferulae TaxID=1854641 RepID=UPI0019D452B3|nr:hypothetical protein [Croceibacterium ferulae]